MDKPMSSFHFAGMSFIFSIRDLIRPPELVLRETELQPGFHVLDYGCGTGTFSIAAARLVGESGKVYALDIHPSAVERVRKRASKEGLNNVVAIRADSPQPLESGSIDVVLLYDIFHMLSDKKGILRELHRVLKQNSIMSFSDHHMKEDAILAAVTENGYFKLSQRGKRTYSFLKA